MEKTRRKKHSTKPHTTEQNSVQLAKLNSVNEDSPNKKHSKSRKKRNNFEKDNNLNPELDKNIYTKHKTSCLPSRLKRRSIKFPHGNKKRISKNWKYSKELENIGKINQSTKSFTPILKCQSYSPDNYQKNKNIFNENLDYQDNQKIVKTNMVAQKFKIANDFDEEHSNIFLKEKDEGLKLVILSDVIEESEYELSSIYAIQQKRKNAHNKSHKKGFNSSDCLFNLNDSQESLSQLLMEVN